MQIWASIYPDCRGSSRNIPHPLHPLAGDTPHPQFFYTHISLPNNISCPVAVFISDPSRLCYQFLLFPSYPISASSNIYGIFPFSNNTRIYPFVPSSKSSILLPPSPTIPFFGSNEKKLSQKIIRHHLLTTEKLIIVTTVQSTKEVFSLNLPKIKAICFKN